MPSAMRASSRNLLISSFLNFAASRSSVVRMSFTSSKNWLNFASSSSRSLGSSSGSSSGSPNSFSELSSISGGNAFSYAAESSFSNFCCSSTFLTASMPCCTSNNFLRSSKFSKWTCISSSVYSFPVSGFVGIPISGYSLSIKKSFAVNGCPVFGLIGGVLFSLLRLSKRVSMAQT